MIKDKFSQTIAYGQSANDKSNNQNELKKIDLVDLGVLLIIAATGGLDVMSQEALNSLSNLPTSCCLLHSI
jgi:hypothetical protein